MVCGNCGSTDTVAYVPESECRKREQEAFKKAENVIRATYEAERMQQETVSRAAVLAALEKFELEPIPFEDGASEVKNLMDMGWNNAVAEFGLQRDAIRNENQ
jgi:hypothetical protein